MSTQLCMSEISRAEHSTFYSQNCSLSSLTKIDDVLVELGLEKNNIPDSLIIDRNAQTHLSSDLNEQSAIIPKILTTNDLDQYKSWIGRDDAGIDNTQWILPTAPWEKRAISDFKELTTEEKENIEKAGWVYLFGNSTLVKSYREIIEFSNAPFEVAIYAARKVTIRSGSSLIVSGTPAILLFEELNIHLPGDLQIYTVCHAKIGTLQSK